MIYKLSKYLGFKGFFDFIELPDSSYGEWIVIDDNKFFYHINIFDNSFDANTKIKLLIEQKHMTIEAILNKINQTQNINLKLQTLGSFIIRVNNSTKELKLKSIPQNWLSEFKI